VAGNLAYAVLLVLLAFVPVTYLLVNAYLSRRRARLHRVPPAPPGDVTIVVPVHHESEGLFAACVRSVAAQGCRWIAVGDGVEEPYRSIVERAGGEFVSLPEPRGKKAALAEGIRTLETPLVLFVDADTRIPRDAVRRLSAYFAPGVGGVGANLSVADAGTGVAYAAEFVERAREVVLRAMSSTGNVLYLDGACVMFRTERVRAYILSEGFQRLEVLGRPSTLGDDWLLTDHLLSQGLATVKAYDVRAVTSPQGTVRAFVRQNVRWSRSSWIRLGRYLRGSGPRSPGLFYRLELIGTYSLPLLVLLLTVLRFPADLRTADRLVVAPLFALVDGTTVPAHAMSLRHFLLVPLPAAAGLAGTGVFLGTVARAVEPSRRLRVIAYGALGSGVLLVTSLYGLLTFWVAPAPSPPRRPGPAPARLEARRPASSGGSATPGP
jgi:cellulose synthase/poly-beta-1,6-N-acetylglucosamine synthase-like glycosyltransferase